MRNSEFFSGIAHLQVPWGSRQISVPVFYYDMMSLAVFMLAPVKNVKTILPSKRMNPYRVTPWHCIVAISAFEYRDTDIEPYNEVSIAVPFVMDRVSPLFTGVLRKAPEVPMMYIHNLPVTTEIARAAGVEFAGFPKFLADIGFERKGEWLSCQVNADGKHILTLTGRKTKLELRPRERIYPITCAHGRLLRLELIWSECNAGLSKAQSDVRLELGNHPIAQGLRGLNLGRVLLYQLP
jgi:hypothetical protein